ncbi:MAG TPA: YbhN family protein [Acidimicrobiales bacterium]|nr:YbhN family protein [Acidimicrobiales bacterium]
MEEAAGAAGEEAAVPASPGEFPPEPTVLPATTVPPEANAPPAATPGPPAKRKRWIPRQIKWTITIVALFFILEYLLLPDLASARKSLNLLGQVNVLWLILAVLLEFFALAAYAELSHTVLTPDSPRRFQLFRVNMSSLAVSHVLPGGTAPGAAVAYRLLTTDLEVPGSVAAFGLATQGVGSAVVLNALFWCALLISIPLSGYNPLYGFAAIAGVILITLFAGTVLLLTRGKHSAADYLHRLASHLPFVNPDRVSSLVQNIADRLVILLRDRALLTHALEWAAANWLLDAASLWLFIFAFGHTISPIDLLVAYGLANILAVIPITPGGLGVVEGILIPTLVGFHVPKAIAILGVLSYRLVNFWLPIPLGGVAYLSLRWGPHARQLRQRAAEGTGRSAGGGGSDGKGGRPVRPTRFGGGRTPPAGDPVN